VWPPFDGAFRSQVRQTPEVGAADLSTNKKQKENMRAILHVHSQESPHDDAWLVGNREGLLVLKRAVEQALNTTHGDGEVSDAQGNPFEVRVLFIADPPDAESWKRAALPYTAVGFQESRPDALWPVSIAPTQRLEAVQVKKATSQPKPLPEPCLPGKPCPLPPTVPPKPPDPTPR
jgi:hypothetical protein